MLLLCSVFSLIVSLALKSPYGERSIKYVIFVIVVVLLSLDSLMLLLLLLCSVVSLIVSLALKSPYGERSIKYVIFVIVVVLLSLDSLRIKSIKSHS